MSISVLGQQKPRFKFKQLDIPLHNNEVTSIAEDRYGYIWVSTLIGLHRYDGLNLEFYESSEDSTSLSNPRVECILEDAQGELWIGTNDGLCRYNRDKNSFFRYDLVEDEGKGTFNAVERVTSIVEDSEGVLWLSIANEGLFFKDQRDSTFQPYHHELSDLNLSVLHLQNDSIFWIGTEGNGIAKIDLKTDEVKYYKDEAASEKHQIRLVNDLITDENGDLFIASEYVLARVRKGAEEFEYFDVGRQAYGKMLIDHQKRLWVAVENGGLLLFNEKENSFYNYKHDPDDPYSAPSISYWNLFEDSQNRIWLGSTLDGLSIIDDRIYKFELYNTETGLGKGLNNNIIRYVHEDKKGNLYLATDGGGLNYYDRKAGTYKSWMYDANNPSSIGSDAVLGMTEGSNGKLWVSTWQGGVNIFDPSSETFERFRPNNRDLDRPVVIEKTTSGDFWIGTNHGGLHRYIPSKDQLISFHFEADNEQSIPFESIYGVMEDSNGNIWVGSAGFGLALLTKENIEKGIFQRFPVVEGDSSSLPGGQVSQIFEDHNGTIWVGTSNGLSKYLPVSKNFKNYTEQHGLGAGYIKAIVEDDNYMLWISTEDGLSMFNPETEIFKNYDELDGLQDSEFSRFCGKKLKTGELVFGGINGFNIFWPDQIEDNPFKPKVYISGLKVFNKDVIIDDASGILNKQISQSEEITLNHDQSIFTLEYIGVSYNHPEKNQFAYRLMGLEEDWNYVGNQQSATYTNLSPGKYQFQVKGANHDDVWNEQGATLDIIVLPPWYRTWWAYMFSFTLLLMVIYGIITMRTANLRHRQRLLTRLVNERTHELEQKNSKIEMQSEELQTYVDQLHELNNKLNNSNERLEETVQQRTKELLERNSKLADFAFINAHNLRAPVANIKGLIQLFEVRRSREEINQFIEMLKGQSENLDKILKEIQEMLDHDDTLKNQQQRVESKIMKSETGYPDLD